MSSTQKKKTDRYSLLTSNTTIDRCEVFQNAYHGQKTKSKFIVYSDNTFVYDGVIPMAGSKQSRTAINGLYTIYDYTLSLPFTVKEIYSLSTTICLMDHGRTNNSGNQRLYHDDILPGGICDDECRVTGTNRKDIRGYYLFKTASIQYKDEYSVSLSFHIEGII